MRIFLTGGTGFIGTAVARRLRGRGDDVVALVRDPGTKTSSTLADLGCRLVTGDLSDSGGLADAMTTCDAVIHSAGVYEVGIPAERRPAMYEANVTGTENVLGAAVDAGVGRIVHVSTVGAFGNTRGQVVDEAAEHPESYVSYYDETKHLAHVAAQRRIDQGAPVVIVQPGAVYGPGDPSIVGSEISNFLRGRLVAQGFPEAGISPVHLDDLTDGILAALDRGEIGEAYVLAGEPTTMRQLIRTVAEITDRRPPRFTMPSGLLRALVPLGRFLGPPMGYGPNLHELVSASDGVTYWASSGKAQRELGFAPRPLHEGLRQTLLAEGRL